MLSGQNVTCTRGFVLQSDWYRRSKAPEVDNFYRGCYKALSFPPFLREPGDEASLTPFLHTGSDRKLDGGKAWERGSLTCMATPRSALEKEGSGNFCCSRSLHRNFIGKAA